MIRNLFKRGTQRDPLLLGYEIRECHFPKLDARVRVPSPAPILSFRDSDWTAPAETRTPNWHQANMLNYECGWKDGDRSAVGWQALKKMQMDA